MNATFVCPPCSTINTDVAMNRLTMKIRKTVKVPIHFETTKKKMSYLDNLTARLTHAVHLLCDKINEEGFIPGNTYDVRRFSDYLEKKTGLSTGFIQQVEDKVLWMYKQYKRNHEKWERAMRNAREGSRWYRKLKQREPGVPDPKKHDKKISTFFDYRTGKIQRTESLDLTDWVMHISTLRKRETIDVLLNPSEWHEEQIEKADEIKSFEIVHHPERYCKYVVHITYEYEVQTVRTTHVCGVDLGIKRDLSAVLIDEDGVERFNILRTCKSERLKELDDRISHLRREEKYSVLKKLRNKRKNVTEYFDRKLAKQFAESIPDGTIVFFGNPKDIRYNKYKGNRDKAGRKLLQHWSFSRMIDQCILKLNENGNTGEKITEWNTSILHYKCGESVKRPYNDSFQRVYCSRCDDELDAEFNASINIAVRGIALHSDICRNAEHSFDSRNPGFRVKSIELDSFWQNMAGAKDGLARTMDDSGLEPWMSMEAHSLGCG